MACCEGCGTRFSLFKKGKACPGPCGKKALCTSCLSFACVAPEDEGVRPFKVTAFCKGCFKATSSLDFGHTEDVLGPAPGEALTLVYVHGAGGNRRMFHAHAQSMVARGNYRCVLLDLPGHGSRMEQPLTLETAMTTIADTIRTHAPPYRGSAPVLVGGSLGGYICMEFLGAHPDLVSGAVLLMCGQNTGVGRGVAAGLGLMMMKALFPMLSSVTMLKGLIGEAQKNGHISDSALLDMALRTGMFFGQAAQHIEILKQSNPRASLPRFQGPALFINGSKDHHDSDEVWAGLLGRSRRLVYEGGDHFFSHDDRFADRLVQDTLDFLQQELLGAQGGSEAPANSL